MTLKEFIFALINFLILAFALYKIGRKDGRQDFCDRRVRFEILWKNLSRQRKMPSRSHRKWRPPGRKRAAV